MTVSFQPFQKSLRESYTIESLWRVRGDPGSANTYLRITHLLGSLVSFENVYFLLVKQDQFQNRIDSGSTENYYQKCLKQPDKCRATSIVSGIRIFPESFRDGPMKNTFQFRSYEPICILTPKSDWYQLPVQPKVLHVRKYFKSVQKVLSRQ